jgi:hypothetical protein
MADLDDRERRAWEALKACPDRSGPEHDALQHEWSVLHRQRDKRDMAAMQAFLTDVFREPCPVCERRRAKRRERAAANRVKKALPA